MMNAAMFVVFVVLLVGLPYATATTLADLAGCWENTTTGQAPYLEFALVLNNAKTAINQWTQYSIATRAGASKQDSSGKPTMTNFAAKSDTLTFTIASATLFSYLQYTFANASFDRMVGSSMPVFGNGNSANFVLRRPAGGKGALCSETLPPRPTDPPTPRPPTPPPTPAPLTTTTTTVIDIVGGSTAATVPTVRVTSATATTTTVVATTSAVAGGGPSGAQLVGSNGQMVADDESESAIDGTGIGLIVAGVLLLLLSAVVVWCVIAKRRKREIAVDPAAAPQAETVPVNAQSGKFNEDIRAYSSVNLVVPPSVTVGEYAAPPAAGDTVTSTGSSSGGGSAYAPMPMRP